MAALVSGVGTALPEFSITREQALAHAHSLTCSTHRQMRLINEVYRRTEIGHRSSVVAWETHKPAEPFFKLSTEGGPSTAERMDRYQSEAPVLAARAALKALESAEVSVSEVTHLVTVSCTGFSAPGLDIALIKALPLSPSVARTHVGFMGCHGMINGLKVADNIARANDSASVLVCATEICSLHFQYSWCSDNVISNALFSDGAAAAVISPRSGTWRIGAGTSYIVPDSEGSMTWRIGNNGFLMTLSPEVPELIRKYLPQWLSQWLATQELTISDIKGWVVHPGGPRILDAVEESLQLPVNALDASRRVLAEHGNMSSPTVLFVLEHVLKKAPSLPALFLGFGPGLTIEALLLYPNSK